MVIHERLHTGEKPYACAYGCGKSYKWLSSINFHQARCSLKSTQPELDLPAVTRQVPTVSPPSARVPSSIPVQIASRDDLEKTCNFTSPNSWGASLTGTYFAEPPLHHAKELATNVFSPPVSSQPAFSTKRRRNSTLTTTVVPSSTKTNARSEMSNIVKRTRKRKRVASIEIPSVGGKSGSIAFASLQEKSQGLVPLSPMSPHSSSTASEEVDPTKQMEALLTVPFHLYGSDHGGSDVNGLHGAVQGLDSYRGELGVSALVDDLSGAPAEDSLPALLSSYGPNFLSSNKDRMRCPEFVCKPEPVPAQQSLEKRCDAVPVLPGVDALSYTADRGLLHGMAPFSPVTPEPPGLPSDKIGSVFDDFSLAGSAIDLFPNSEVASGCERADIPGGPRALVGSAVDPFEGDTYGTEFMPF